MAFDDGLAERLREVLADEPGIIEKPMFGGLAFLYAGNMSVGVHGGALIVRVGPLAHDDALSKPGARVFDITGKPMKGWIVVEPEGIEDDHAFAVWVAQGVEFAKSLPPK